MDFCPIRFGGSRVGTSKAVAVNSLVAHSTAHDVLALKAVTFQIGASKAVASDLALPVGALFSHSKWSLPPT